MTSKRATVGFIAFAAISNALIATQSGTLPPLPVSRAPFERTDEVLRRPIKLVAFPFFARNSGEGPDYAQRFVQWAEFVSGDKIAVVNGYDWRICHHGRTGFGKVIFYRSDADADSPSGTAPEPFGRELLAWMEIRFLDGAQQYDPERDVFKNATLDVDAKTAKIQWLRPCKGKAARYSLAPAGDGMLVLDWEMPSVPVEFRLRLCGKSTNGASGVENGTRLYMNRNSETERVEIAFPDGEVKKSSDSEYVWRTEAASGRVLIDLCGSTTPNSPTSNSFTPNAGVIDFYETDALDVPVGPTGNLLANGSFEQGLTGWNYWYNGEPWSVVEATGEPLESITDEAKVGDKALRMRSSKPRGT